MRSGRNATACYNDQGTIDQTGKQLVYLWEPSPSAPCHACPISQKIKHRHASDGEKKERNDRSMRQKNMFEKRRVQKEIQGKEKGKVKKALTDPTPPISSHNIDPALCPIS